MVSYVCYRLLSACLVIVVTSMIVFAVFFLGPNNTASYLCNQNGQCTPERQALLEEQLGLNDNVVSQYGTWVNGLFQGRDIDMGATYHCAAPCLGISFVTKEPVTQELVERFPATLSLACGGAIIFLSLGLSVGGISARWRGSTMDRLLVGSTLLVSSVPFYLAAFIIWLVFSQQLGWFSDNGYAPFTENPVAWFSGLVLPWIAIGLYNATQYARFGRGSMIEAMNEDFIRTAVAKGVSPRAVLVRHASRAAIVPIVTIFGLDFASLLAGTVFTEYIFGIDGIGKWALEAIPYDFPVIAATVLVAATLVVVANLIVDLCYALLDPRVRLS